MAAARPGPGDAGARAGDGGGLVLVVEHDSAVAELERLYLAREGFAVHLESDPALAPGTATRVRPRAVVLDLSAPDLEPADLYRRVARAAQPAPVICVLGGDTDPCEVGEPRLTRPFSPRLLVAAVSEAVRRRADGEPGDALRAGAVTLEPRGRSVRVADGGPVSLTATEFDLLAFLMSNAGRVFSREQLLEAVWAPGASAGTRTVDVHVAQLRAKLGPASPIRTVRGVGYAIDA
jgi:DNA-binding response OmpR family regulator